ncbi:MAG TPA: hypothetical protein VD884_18045 [Ohtaekwangia sp.]|nr:hypothetical protein [Ohtaekwangia sp.]
MKKIPLLITLLLTVLLTGGYFLYDQFFNKPVASSWDLVPPETVLVYESSTCAKCIEDLKNMPLVELISRAARLTEEDEPLKELSEFTTSFQQPTLVSLHITKKENFDFIFYLPFNKNVQLRIDLVLEKFRKTKGVKLAVREFNGIQINEVVHKKTVFSWIIIDNNWIGSFTPILVEDVIRTYTTEGVKNFKHALSSVYQLPKLKKDGGNVYVHLQNFAKWFSLFTNEKPPYLTKQFGQSALLDVKINDDHNLVLNGFSVERSATDNFVLSVFQNQTPVPFQLKNVVPNRSLMFASYGISDGRSFYEGIKNIKSPDTDSLNTLSKSLNIDFENLFESFSGEIGVSWMENRDETFSRVILINNGKGIDEWMKASNAIANALSIDTIFFEKYGSYEIREIPAYRFPEKLLGPFVTGFDRTFYTSSGNTMFMAEDLAILKKFLNDIDNEDTWGKSVAQNTFLESTLLESNISLFINTPKIWNIIKNAMHPRWSKFIDQNETLLNSLGMGAIQFSHLNDSYYTNISWDLKTANTSKTERERKDRLMVNFEHPIARFEIVKSHVDRTDEILLQDSAKNLSLISGNGKVLWQVNLPDFIVGEVHQIDFLANGKLQYFFATPGQLHVIDRLGNYVEPYPVSITETEIEFVSVVDYDHSKKYRWLIASRSGRLWMFDKSGTNLEGWQPRIIDERLITAPRHYRILGRDYILAIRRDGIVNLMNRRSEFVKNFPLDLKSEIGGDYFIEVGKTRANTLFTVIGKDGVRITFNLEGKIQTKEVLVKNTLDAKFWMLTEKDMDSYLIVRQEPKQLTMLNPDLQEVVISDFIGNNPIHLEYQNFGSGRKYIVITDLSQDLSFVYNLKGTLLTTLPIDSFGLKVKPDASGEEKLYYYLSKNFTIGSLE